MKIIAHREATWMDEITDFRQWDHLCRAFGVELQLISNWTEAKPVGNVYLADERGEERHTSHAYDLNGTYVFGRTGLDLFKAGIPHHGSVRIDTPNSICLFGVEAAALLLGRATWL